MSQLKKELQQINIPKDLHKRSMMGVQKAKAEQSGGSVPRIKKHSIFKRVSVAAAVCMISVSLLSFTPALAAIQEMYDKIFSSNHIDDKGLQAVLEEGHGQAINQTFYDEENDITVEFQSILTDSKETKLLVIYQSEKTDLENYSLDIFEGHTEVYVVDEMGQEKKLNHVGWGSRYYDKKENKVAQALAFDSIKEFEGQNIMLEMRNLTEYDHSNKGDIPWIKVETTWPLTFNLTNSYIAERETIELNKQFTFENETYTIKQVEFSAFDTRVVITGTDTGPYIEERSGEKFDVMSKLEEQFLNAKKFEKGYGHIVDESKSGVFLRASGEKIEPIFNKNELPGPLGEYVMVFAPVKDSKNTMLEVGEDLKILLTE
ncbi:hypothetical protein JOC85_003544 [Bacillus mesophilus]|uniref:DUF4179 domain-containing protein n=1 Tax=Bacillus mesophilus TaxID=1808955 RepID=A0A6M0QA84_9BACI|nr:DUF4179 domain-containing protein [Bacillus mesophilus]MBM7662734.1 hypothetical protein [Bacillus mesophilus]NEY73205.1 DUF4179 domain-containing protein [Bacillus mesophilus]